MCVCLFVCFKRTLPIPHTREEEKNHVIFELRMLRKKKKKRGTAYSMFSCTLYCIIIMYSYIYNIMRSTTKEDVTVAARRFCSSSSSSFQTIAVHGILGMPLPLYIHSGHMRCCKHEIFFRHDHKVKKDGRIFKFILACIHTKIILYVSVRIIRVDSFVSANNITYVVRLR